MSKMRSSAIIQLCLVLLGTVALIPAQEVGSGIDCSQEKELHTDCRDNETVRLFSFSQAENSCRGYTTCPLEDETYANVFTSRESCENNCPATECPYPSHITNGFYYISRSEDGTKTAHYNCLNSYKLVGPAERKCLYNGSWKEDDPTCELSKAQTCDDSPDVDGAAKHYICQGQQTPGCLVLYTCKEHDGYQLLSGIGYRRCGNDGIWTNNLPVCARLRVMQDESEVSDEIKAKDGETNFQVQCVIEPVVPPTASIKWNPVGENGKTEWLPDKSSLVLNFDTVHKQDAGRYKCSMEMEKHIEKSIEFVVISPDSSLSLMLKYEQIFTYAIMLTCVYKGQEKPTVNWYFDEQPVVSGVHYIQSDKTSSHLEINFNVLLIMYPTPSDYGAYACEANNDNSTQEWFHISPPPQATAGTAKRSLDPSLEMGITYTKEDVASTYSICTDKSTVTFIGRFKREIKVKEVLKYYILHVERPLHSALSGFPRLVPKNNILAGVADMRFFPMDISLNDLYIFIVRTDSDGKWMISNIYPYSKRMEIVLEEICS